MNLCFILTSNTKTEVKPLNTTTMIQPNYLLLSDILKKIDDTAQPGICSNPVDAITDTLDIFEEHLKSLQDLKDCLPHMEVVSSAEAVSLLKRIKRIYTILGVFEDISLIDNYIHNNIDNEGVAFTGVDLTERLLLNKYIIVLNRKLFSLGKLKLDAMRRTSKI